MILLVRYRQCGGQVQCRVFTQAYPHATPALVGALVFAVEEEWPHFVQMMDRVQFLHEDTDQAHAMDPEAS